MSSSIPSEYKAQDETKKPCGSSCYSKHTVKYDIYKDVKKCPEAEAYNSDAIKSINELSKKFGEDLKNKCGKNVLIIDNDISLDKRIDEIVTLLDELRTNLQKGIEKVNSEISNCNTEVRKRNKEFENQAKPSSYCQSRETGSESSTS